MVQHLVEKKFLHEETLEDHWMNAVDDYNVHIRDYCRMSLHLEEKILNMELHLKALEKNVPEIMIPCTTRIKLMIGPS